MSQTTKFPPNIIQELKYYVYIYSDPDTGRPFYIGKGSGNRCFSHLSQEGDSEKIAILNDLKKQGKTPKIEILVWGLDEATALKVEAAAIDLIGIKNLTNIQKGHHSALYGRIDVDELCHRFNPEELNRGDIPDNCLLIRVKKYHYGMTDLELYDLTRRAWKVRQDRIQKIEYVLSVYDGFILAVYKVAGWYPAHSTFNTIPVSDAVKQHDIEKHRMEFVGQLAPSSIQKQFVGKSVRKLYKQGEANPVKYSESLK